MNALCNGFSTGGYAAAAAKAALPLLREDRATEEVEIPIPNGQRRRLPPVEYVWRADEGAEATRPPLAECRGTGGAAEAGP